MQWYRKQAFTFIGVDACFSVQFCVENLDMRNFLSFLLRQLELKLI